MGKHCNHGVCLFHYSSAAIITRVISDSTVRTNLGPRPPSCCSQYLQFMLTSPARLVGNYQLQGKPPNQQLSLFNWTALGQPTVVRARPAEAPLLGCSSTPLVAGGHSEPNGTHPTQVPTNSSQCCWETLASAGKKVKADTTHTEAPRKAPTVCTAKPNRLSLGRRTDSYLRESGSNVLQAQLLPAAAIKALDNRAHGMPVPWMRGTASQPRVPVGYCWCMPRLWF